MRRSGSFRTAKSVIDTTNSRARIAICLCLDTSSSMEGAAINELNAGIRLFLDTIRGSDEAKYAADIAVVTFGSGGAQCVQNFAQIYDDNSALANFPSLKAGGKTLMGEAVNIALDMIESRRLDYKSVGIQHYHPWLILMSDGISTGNVKELDRAVERTCKLVNDNKLAVFPIVIGKDSGTTGFEYLAKFSPKAQPKRLIGLNFKEFFVWLSESTEKVSTDRNALNSNAFDYTDLPAVSKWSSDGGWSSL